MNQNVKIPAVRRQTSIQIPHHAARADSWIQARNDLFMLKSEILIEMGSPIARSLSRNWIRLMSGLGSCAGDARKARVPDEH